MSAAAASAFLLPGAARGATSNDDAFAADVSSGSAHPWTAVPNPGGRPLGFTVVGDNTALARPGVFDQTMTQVSWLRPDFVLSVGDLIEGYLDDRAAIESQWAVVDRSIAKLNCPFVACVGNHDINNAATHEAWVARRGPTYYSFTYKGALFVVLNTEDPPVVLDSKAFVGSYYDMVRLMNADPETAMKSIDAWVTTPAIAGAKGASNVVNISDGQVAWVRDTLARHPNPAWTFVVMHKPGWKSSDPQFAKIQAMLAGRRFTVLAGHTHYFTHEVIDGHDYINMATCGGIRQRAGPGNIDHVLNITLTATGPLYANMRLTGLLNVAGESGQILAY